MMNARSQLTAFSTIIRKEVTRFLRIWPQTLLPPVITMALYFIIFGRLMGERIGTMGGVDYMSFVVPGLVMMAVINSSYSNVVSSFYSAKFTKCIEEILVSPTPNYIILAGYIGGGMLRGGLVGFIVLLVSLFFSPLEIHNIFITVLVVMLTSLLFASAGLVNAIYANSFDDISIVPTFILTPLTYLGGVFYSTSLLPDFWQGVSMLNPVLYLVSTFRYGLLGFEDVSVFASLIGIFVFAMTLLMVCLALLEKSVRLRN